MASRMFLLYILVLHGCMQNASLVNADAHVLVTATPSRILEGFTKNLALTCSLNNDGTFFNVVHSMILSMSSSGNDSYGEVASITSSQPQTVHTRNSLGAHVTGALTSGGDCNITYEWTYPATDIAGKYLCTVFGMDSFGHPVQAEGVTHIDEMEVGFQMILEKLRQMEVTQELLLSRLNITETRLNITEPKLNITEMRLNSTESELAKSQLEQNNTHQKLEQIQAKQNDTKLHLDKTQMELDKMKNHRNNLMSAITAASTTYNNHTYIVSNPQWETAQVANVQCQVFGGYLAEIDNQQEFEFLMSFLKVNNLSNGHYTYISGTDHATENTWTYINSGKPLTYFKWQPGEPSHGRSGGYDEYCLAIDQSAFGMIDLNCDWPSEVCFMCEIPS